MNVTCFLYCVSSIYTDKCGMKKLGLTIHPVHRMRVYNTGDAPGIDLEKKYDGLWQVNAKSNKERLLLEKHLHDHFISVRKKNDNGKYTEWFNVSFQEVEEFLNSQPYLIRQLSIEDINIIQERSKNKMSTEDVKDYIEEMNLITENKTEEISIYNKFISFFLKGRIPRRVQTELWDAFTEICNNPDDILYKGIVQWPTGVGKTIATLMLIVISAERCKRRGTTYRGLFVSPKNDILDTISVNFDKLSSFGITVYDGSHGKLSKLEAIPKDKHIIIMGTQSALTDQKILDHLPPITHVHYDEVHRITGQQYFTLLKKMLIKWNSEFLTGTSATPFTSSLSQREKIIELFGNPLNMLHTCGVDEAVKEGWIAKPRFIVSILPPIDNTDAHLRGTVEALGKYIHFKGVDGKFICYIETSIADVKAAADIARKNLSWAKIYTAIDGERTDNEFINAPIDKTPKILFACQRYREGSDVRGIEMTAKLIGNTSAAYILLQICGRAGRIDGNKEKEGWCLLIRPSEKGTSQEDVLDSIILDIIEFVQKSERVLNKNEIKQLLKTYVGDISLSGSRCTLDETIERVQSVYIRKEYAKRTPKEKYAIVRNANKEYGFMSKDDYKAHRDSLIEDPKAYFKDYWISWYHFLGVDTSSFPERKTEWVHICKDREIKSWDEYKKAVTSDLPLNPGEMYEDYTNWDNEFGIEEENV